MRAARGLRSGAPSTTVCGMSVPVVRSARPPLRHAVALIGALSALGALTACSASHAAPPVAPSKSGAPASPSAPVTYDPLSGPVESASQLPKSCSAILGDQDLTDAFGSPQVGDTSYGNYAPLPNIGRTGRVTCGFGIAVDQKGNPGPPVVTVSVITYDTASRAASRVAAEVTGTVAKGASEERGLVNGHPATVLLAPAAAASGDTELVMADGDRTFVITIPVSKLSGSGAVNVLTKIAAVVYQHTLPPGGSAAASAAATPSPSAS